MPKEKVKFGLKNVHYAMLTTGEDGKVTFGTPKRISGAVSMSLEAQGETETFYADDVAYYVSVANDGYQGSLEFALITDEFLVDVLGYREDETDHVLVENSMAESKPFALIYEVSNDQKPTRRVFFNCTATRPAENNSTINKTKTPNTESLTLTVAPLADGSVRAKTTDQTPAETYNGWFTKVWRPAGSE